MKPYHVLLVEDEPEFLTFNARHLEAEGYRVTAAATLQEAGWAVRSDPPDLVVLDILMPDGSGLDFCRDLRADTGVPVIFLTSLGEQEQIVAGLRAGGDDYLTKPYHIGELVARVEAQLRRAALLRQAGDAPEIRGLTLDLIRQRAFWEGRDMNLRPKEFQLLALLARSRNRWRSAAELYTAVWGMAACDTRTVAMHLSFLRLKLQAGTGNALEVEHARGRGYRLASTVPDGCQEAGPGLKHKIL